MPRRMLHAWTVGKGKPFRPRLETLEDRLNPNSSFGFDPPVDVAVGPGPKDVATGDFNGDGFADFITANSSNGTISVRLGNGDGTFAAVANFAAGTQPTGMAVADFNGDTILDVAVMDAIDPDVGVLIGNGDGTFGSPTGYSLFNFATAQDIVAGDYTGDGFADLIVSGSNDRYCMLENQGDGTFVDAGQPGVTAPRGVALEDFDGDSILDLAVTNNTAGEVGIYLGDGASFTFLASFATGSGAFGITTADVNTDGEWDLIVTNNTADSVSVLMGNGDGTFQTAVSYGTMEDPQDVEAADLDSDGFLDIVVSNRNSSNLNVGKTVSVLLNNGDGTFQVALHFPVSSGPESVAIADFDEDGELDLAVACSGVNAVSILLNGPGSFALVQHIPSPYRMTGSTAADFDNDGNMDLAIAEYDVGQVQIFMGQGNGLFTLTNTLPAVIYTYSVTAVDFNGDNKMDLIATNNIASVLSVYQGNGDGTFTPLANVSTGSGPIFVVAGFIDGDTIPDLVTANATAGSVSILLGNGDGTFTAMPDKPTGAYTYNVALGDLDSDGDMDIAASNSTGSSLSILLGNGDGTFANAVNYPFSNSPYGLVVRDFDGDAVLDIVFSFYLVTDNIAFMHGNGDGTFDAPVFYTAGTDPVFLVAEDFNFDGFMDVVAANALSFDMSVMLGHGDGTFTHFRLYRATSGPSCLSVADFDNDFRPDVVVANDTGQSLTVYLNRFSPGPYIDAGGDESITESDTLSRSGYFDDAPGNGPWTATVNYDDGDGDEPLPLNPDKTFDLDHTFVDNGSYFVTVNITDDNGVTGTATFEITVANADPTATFGNDGPKSEGSTATVSFSNANDAPADVLAGFLYSYDFNNDGDFEDPGDLQDVLSPTASLYFDDSGLFTVRGRIADKDGGFTDYLTNVTITNLAPTAVLSNDGPVTEGVAAMISFSGETDVSVTDTFAGFLYSYDFNNDGDFTDPNEFENVAVASRPCLFDDSDGFTVRCRIIDKDGGFTDYTTVVIVTNVAPTATLANDGPVNEGSTVTISFTNIIDPSAADSAALLFSYDFNNDGDFTDPGEFADVAASSQPFAFDDNGIYTVRGRIKDKDGGFTDYTTNVTVTNANPTATLTNDGPVSEGGTITISFTGIFDPSTADTLAGFLFSYDFNNDGDFSDSGELIDVGSASAPLSLADNANFLVHGRIKDKDGGVADYTTLVTFTNVAPTATFGNDGPAAEGSSTTVAFAFTSMFDPSGNDTGAGFLYSYDWNNDGDFDDFNESQDVTVSARVLFFDDNGVFTMHGRIKDKDGGFTDYTTTVTITNVAPTATVTNDGPVGEGLNFTVTCLNVIDPSATDTAAGFTYRYDWNNDGDFTDPGDINGTTNTSFSFAFPASGVITVHVQIEDKDGGVSDFTTNVTVVNADFIVVSYDKGAEPLVRVVDADDPDIELFSFLAYDDAFHGGVRVAVADVNGDGVADIITAPGSGGKTANGTLDVRGFDGRDGTPLTGFLAGFEPFGPNFKKGLNIAAADFNGDGFADIAVAPAEKFAPRVIIFSGFDGSILFDYLAYADVKAYRGGVRLAVGDVTADGVPDLITHGGLGTNSRIMVYDGGSGQASGGPGNDINPFGDIATVKGPLFISTGDFNGDGRADIVVSTGKGRSQLRVIDGATGQIVADVVSPDPDYDSGARVGVADANNDGVPDIVVGTCKEKGEDAVMLVLDGATFDAIDAVFADPTLEFRGGVFVAGGR